MLRWARWASLYVIDNLDTRTDFILYFTFKTRSVITHCKRGHTQFYRLRQTLPLRWLMFCSGLGSLDKALLLCSLCCKIQRCIFPFLCNVSFTYGTCIYSEHIYPNPTQLAAMHGLLMLHIKVIYKKYASQDRFTSYQIYCDHGLTIIFIFMSMAKFPYGR